eukprot:287698-Amphidinium_carterae.1
MSLAVPATNVWHPSWTIGHLLEIAYRPSTFSGLEGVVPQPSFKGPGHRASKYASVTVSAKP